DREEVVRGIVGHAGGALQQRTTSTTYDAADDAISVDRPVGHDLGLFGIPIANPAKVTTRYAYDALGRRTAITEAAGTGLARTTTTVYDAADEVRAVVQPYYYFLGWFLTTTITRN